MANRFSVINGDLYNGGTASEMKVLNGSDIRIKASGTGSCQVVGKLTANGEAKVLSLVRLRDFAVVDTITDNEIYAFAASGCTRYQLLPLVVSQTFGQLYLHERSDEIDGCCNIRCCPEWQ